MPIGSHLLQATKNLLSDSHGSMGPSRTELSIPCPLDRLPHMCGACSTCLSVSHRCKGPGDKREPWASEAAEWTQ